MNKSLVVSCLWRQGCWLLVVMIVGCNNPFVPPKPPKPEPVELTHPRDGDTLGPGNVTFSWKPVPNKEIYHLRVSNTETFDSSIIDVKTIYTAVTFYLPDTLKYFWQVRVQTKKYLEWSDWCDKWDFLINIAANRAPVRPHNPTPPNDATDVSTDVNLYWWGGDPDGDTVTYTVYFGKNSSSVDSIGVVIDASGDTLKQMGYYALPELEPGLIYYWKIGATDQWDATAMGDIWKFTTTLSPDSPPHQPVITLPSSPHYIDELLIFKVKTTDPENNAISYNLNFGDGNQSGWSPYKPSGQEIDISHTYTKLGSFYVKAKAMDTPGCNESRWSDSAKIDVQVGPGAVWVADVDGWRVIKVGIGGSRICSYFNCSPATDSCHPEFKQPLTLDVDPQDGCVWIACSMEERLFKVSPKGKFAGFHFFGGSSNPSTPCVANNGDCWVSVAYKKKIVKLDRVSCNEVDTIIDNLPGDIYPVAIALDEDSGWIWAVESPGPMATNGYVSKFDISTHNRIFQLSGFKGNWAEVDPVTHYCWVADIGNNQVAKISPTGVVTRFSGFNIPSCVSIDPINQCVWVADKENCQIVKLSYAGAELLRLSGFSYPTAVEVNPNDGSCWVSDYSNSRVVKLSPAGVQLFEVTGFVGPMGLSVNPNPDP